MYLTGVQPETVSVGLDFLNISGIYLVFQLLHCGELNHL